MVLFNDKLSCEDITQMPFLLAGCSLTARCLCNVRDGSEGLTLLLNSADSCDAN